MTENEQTKIVKDFIEEVRKKLPFWLKDNKQEVEEILSELENHIWDRAHELSQGNYPTAGQIYDVLSKMGSPKKIASEYKRRGTPKFYITEELTPMYIKSIAIAFGIIVFVNLLSMIISLFTNPNIGEVIGDTFSGIFNGLALLFIFITSIFVFLSLEGYIPEDLTRDKVAKSIQTKGEEVERSYEEHKRIEKERKKEEKERKKYKLVKGEYFLDAILGFVFGILLILMPINTINQHLSAEFINWFRLLGLMFLIEGMINFSQISVGNKLRTQQVLLILHGIVEFAKIPIFLMVYHNIAMLPYPPVDMMSAANYEELIAILIIVIVVVHVIQGLAKIGRTIHIEIYKEKYAPNHYH